jgi:hypothetical protein
MLLAGGRRNDHGSRRNRGVLGLSFRGAPKGASPESIITGRNYGFEHRSRDQQEWRVGWRPACGLGRALINQIARQIPILRQASPKSQPRERDRWGLDSRRSHRPPLLRNRYISKASCRACLDLHVIADGLHTSLGQLFFRAVLPASPTPSNAFQLCRNSGSKIHRTRIGPTRGYRPPRRRRSSYASLADAAGPFGAVARRARHLIRVAARRRNARI